MLNRPKPHKPGIHPVSFVTGSAYAFGRHMNETYGSTVVGNGFMIYVFNIARLFSKCNTEFPSPEIISILTNSLLVILCTLCIFCFVNGYTHIYSFGGLPQSHPVCSVCRKSYLCRDQILSALRLHNRTGCRRVGVWNTQFLCKLKDKKYVIPGSCNQVSRISLYCALFGSCPGQWLCCHLIGICLKEVNFLAL